VQPPPPTAVNRKIRHHSQSSEPTTDSGSNSQSPLPNSPFCDADKGPPFVSEQEEKQAGGVLVDRYILDMVRVFAKAHLQMSRFECKEMIATLDQLPPQQQLSPTVMILIGRGYFEMVEYATVRPSPATPTSTSVTEIEPTHRRNERIRRRDHSTHTGYGTSTTTPRSFGTSSAPRRSRGSHRRCSILTPKHPRRGSRWATASRCNASTTRR
jgi:hypothetical protein